MTVRVLPEEVLTVQPANQPTNRSAVNAADAAAVLGEQVDFASPAGQCPTAAGTR